MITVDQSQSKNEASALPARLKFNLATNLVEKLELRYLAKAALEESRFNKAQFSEAKFIKAAEAAAHNPKVHGVLTAHFNSTPIGFAYCQVGEPLIGKGLKICTVQSLFVSNELRSSLLGGRVANGLLNGLKSWAKSRNSDEITLHSTSGVDPLRLGSFLRRRGFKAFGGSFVAHA